MLTTQRLYATVSSIYAAKSFLNGCSCCQTLEWFDATSHVFQKSIPTYFDHLAEEDGYLNDVFDVLDAHRHQCILMGRFALLWMGAAVVQDPVSAHIV
jgi:hypothetical protein